MCLHAIQILNNRIHHMDLYRLSDGKPEALEPLNLEYVLKNCKWIHEDIVIF